MMNLNICDVNLFRRLPRMLMKSNESLHFGCGLQEVLGVILPSKNDGDLKMRALFEVKSI